MLVAERMSKPVVYISPDMPIQDALQLMQRENIRRTPVVKKEKLVGIVSDKDLLNASPSDATSLSIWELNYLLSKITVEQVMTKEVITVIEDTPIEEAARIMADNKIGGLPVMSDGNLVGIITETDLFRIFLELMGAREMGVRVSVLVPDKPGALAKLTGAIAAIDGNIIALGTFSGKDQTNREVAMKVTGVDEESVKAAIKPVVDTMLDIRQCCN
jgi:acetoin utilization protein AcuB